jgi:hypothetical protein
MTKKHPYKVLLALHHDAQLDVWYQLAKRITPQEEEIHLRALVTVPTDQSLSEGTIAARQWRESFQQMAINNPAVHDRVQIHVDYQPMRHIFDEVRELGIDLLIVQWVGPTGATGGVTTDGILKSAPCDVVLVDMKWQPKEGPVLLSLRGGPHLTLGLLIVKALAEESSVTLFHAADRRRIALDLEMLMRADPQIHRIVTTVSGITEGILQEASKHKSIVLGASFQSPERRPPHLVL